jgi:hypothetical protein
MSNTKTLAASLCTLALLVNCRGPEVTQSGTTSMPVSIRLTSELAAVTCTGIAPGDSCIAPFKTSTLGTVTTVVSWESAANSVDSQLAVGIGGCTRPMLKAQDCPSLPASTKVWPGIPEVRKTYSELAAGSYSAYALNNGPATENMTVWVYLTTP